MSHSNYANYTDQELLQVLSDKRQHSPIIDELCNRLCEYMPAHQKETNIKADCPVCEAQLKIAIDVTELGNYELNIEPA